MKKILIIGGGGFIGTNLAKELSRSPDTMITVMDDFSRATKNREFLRSLERTDVIQGDLLQVNANDFAKGSFNEIYMLAAIVGVNEVNQNPLETLVINTSLNLKFIELAKHIQPDAVLFASTSEVYAGAVETGLSVVPTDEDTPVCFVEVSHPRNTYAISKLVGEAATIHAGMHFNFRSVNIRYHNVYGPNMGFRHVIPHLVERFLKKENPFQIYGATQTRAFTFISDAIRGTIAAMENGANGATYHVGATEEITIEELTKFVGNIMEFEGEYVTAPTYPGSVSRRCPNTTKATKELNFQTSVGWQTGVSETTAWYWNYYENNTNRYPSFYDS